MRTLVDMGEADLCITSNVMGKNQRNLGKRWLDENGSLVRIFKYRNDLSVNSNFELPCPNLLEVGSVSDLPSNQGNKGKQNILSFSDASDDYQGHVILRFLRRLPWFKLSFRCFGITVFLHRLQTLTPFTVFGT